MLRSSASACLKTARAVSRSGTPTFTTMTILSSSNVTQTPPVASQSAPQNPGASEPPGFKSTEQLRAENPTLPRTQINKLYAQQYNQPVLTADEIEDLKRKYPPPAPRTAGT